MKKLLFGLVATVMLSVAGNAQTSKSDLEKTFGELIKQEVPTEIQGKTLGAEVDKVNPVYIAKQNGWAIIVSNETGIVDFYYTSNMKMANEILVSPLGMETLGKVRPSPYRRCEKSSSDVGAIICVVNVFSEWVTGLF